MNHLYRLAVTVALAIIVFASPVHASDEAILYPVYEGWARNTDGSATLVFGYYNASAKPIEISPGLGNGFTPTPEDRGQPVVFLPGRQRDVCRMVVAADFGGNLQWRLEHGGVVALTTERGGVDPLYLLEDIGASFRSIQDIDTKSATKGVCLNRAPTVSAGRDRTAIVGERFELRGLVRDDGLPRSSSTSSGALGQWRQISGPGDAKATAGSDAAQIWLEFAAAGDYVFELIATDGELSSSDTVTITVANESGH